MRRLATLGLITLASLAFAAGGNKAKDLAKEGDRLYKEGKYHEAADALKQAYELDKNPVLLFNIARAYDQAGDLQVALDTYRQFIAIPDIDSQLIKKANLAMDRLRALVAKNDADKQLQEAEAKRLHDEAEATKRRLEKEAADAKRAADELAAKEAERQREAKSGIGPRRAAGIVLGVLALGGVGTGVAFGVLANHSKASFTNATTADDKDKFKAATQQQALIADISFASAIAFGVVFAIVFPWSSLGGSSSSGQVNVVLAPDGAMVGGTF
jgi:tetratricopeptide (TPR) repeat protein